MQTERKIFSSVKAFPSHLLLLLLPADGPHCVHNTVRIYRRQPRGDRCKTDKRRRYAILYVIFKSNI